MSPAQRVVVDREAALARLLADVDDAGEQLEPCTDAGAACGIRRSASTWIRLAKSGRLDAAKCGGAWLSTRSAVRRFLLDSTKRALGRRAPKKRRSTRRKRERGSARAYLESVGLERREL